MEEPSDVAALEAELERVTAQLAEVEQERQEDLLHMQNAFTLIAEKFQKHAEMSEEQSQESEMQIAGLNARLSAAESALNDSEEIQKRQAEMLEEAESNIKMLSDKALSMKRRGEDSGAESSHLEAENYQLIARLREAETTLEEQREALSIASEMVESLEAANAELKRRLEDDESSSSGSDSSGDSILGESVEQLRADKKDMEDRLKQLEEQQQEELLTAAHAEAAKLVEDNSLLQQQVNQLGEEVERLKRLNKELLIKDNSGEAGVEQEAAMEESSGGGASETIDNGEKGEAVQAAANDLPESDPLFEENSEQDASQQQTKDDGEKELLSVEELTEEVQMLRLLKTSLEEDVERQHAEMEELRNEVQRLSSGGANIDGQTDDIILLQQKQEELQEHSMQQASEIERLEQQKRLLEAELEAAQAAVLSAAQQVGRSASQALEDMQDAISAAALETDVKEENRVLNASVDEAEMVSFRAMQAQISKALDGLAADSDELRSPGEATPAELGEMVLEVLTVLLPRLREEKIQLEGELAAQQLQRGADSTSPHQSSEDQRQTPSMDAKVAFAGDVSHASQDIRELQREAMAEGTSEPAGEEGLDVAALKEELEKTRSEMAYLRECNMELLAQVEAEKEKRNEHGGQQVAPEASKPGGDLAAEVKQLQAELEGLQAVRLELETRLGETSEKLAATEKQAEVGRERVERPLKEQVAALQGKLTTAEQRLNNQAKGGHSSGGNELREQLETQTTILEALKTEVGRLKQGKEGKQDLEHSLQCLEDSLKRLSKTRASIVSDIKNLGEIGQAADLLDELKRARAAIAELTLKQSEELTMRCEAQQLAELRKEEIDALVENLTAQYAEYSKLKGQFLKQQISVQSEKERNEQLQRALGFHKAKVTSLETVLQEHKHTASEAAEMRRRLNETAELLKEKEQSLDSIKKELSAGKKVWKDMNKLLLTDPMTPSQKSTWRNSASAPGSPMPAYYEADDPHRPPPVRAAWISADDTYVRSEMKKSRKSRVIDEPQTPHTPQKWLTPKSGVHGR